MSTAGSSRNHPGGGGGSSEESSNSGSISRQRPEFGKKHRKIIRILTVVAYMMSVSTAALLLSVYYVFLWKPYSTSQNSTDHPTTLARHGVTQIPYDTYNYGESVSYRKYNSFAVSASQSEPEIRYSRYSSPSGPVHVRSSYSRKGHHVSSGGITKSAQHQIPTPQPLIQVNHIPESTSPQTPAPATLSSKDVTNQNVFTFLKTLSVTSTSTTLSPSLPRTPSPSERTRHLHFAPPLGLLTPVGIK